MTPEQAHEHVLLHSERVPEQHEAEWREVARVIARLQAELEARVKQNETQIRIHEQNTSEWKSALESLQSERDALKEQQGQFWDTMRAIAVKGLGLTDSWDLDKDAPMPEDWAAFPTMSANIASVRAERDALAEQVRVMREKFTALLESIGASMDCTFDGSIDEAEHSADCLGCELSNICNKALALAPNAAEQRAKENAEAAAQVPGLVEQLRVMREALEFIDATEHEYPIEYEMDTGAELAATYAWGNAIIECRDAMTLTPTAAETQAKANAEKAAKWDEARQIALALDEKLSEALKTKVGFADKDFEIAVTLLGALIEAAFGQKVPENGLVCSAVLTDGSEIFVEARRRTGEPYVKQAEAWRARIAELEATAKANAEKAALLDWLDHTRPSLSFGYSPEYPLGAWGIYWTNAQTKQVEEAEAERLPDALRSAREARDAGE